LGVGLGVTLFVAAAAYAGTAVDPPTSADGTAWWVWAVILFVVTFVMGILAVLAGVGGGVLFVPIISGFFPFHLDFVRGTGLLVALSGALAAGPGLLKANLASLRLAIPVGVIASTCAIIGATLGLALPTQVIQISLGATILGICALMLVAKKSVIPDVPQADRLSTVLRIYGVYREYSTGQTVNWKVHRTPIGLCLFVVIGIMAGMFGLGAGWANVPVLNLVMGAPRPAEDQRRHQQVPAFDHGHVGGMGLHEQGLRDPADGRAVDGRHHARLLRRRSHPEGCQADVHPVDGHRHPGVRGYQGAHEGTRSLDANWGLSSMQDNPDASVEPTAEQLRYAVVLEKGMYAGLLCLLVTFALYVSGIMEPHIPLDDLPEHWNKNVHEYLSDAGIEAGWSWVGMLGRGDFVNFIGVAALAGVTVIAYLAIIPLLIKSRDTIYTILASLEVLVLLAAASGLIAGGH
jgi:uncharacterized membrane protein YfcA